MSNGDQYQNYPAASGNILGIGVKTLGDSCGAQMAQGDCAQQRQSAKGLLRQRIASLRQEASRLEALARALPEELPTTADEALWDLLANARR